MKIFPFRRFRSKTPPPRPKALQEETSKTPPPGPEALLEEILGMNQKDVEAADMTASRPVGEDRGWPDCLDLRDAFKTLAYAARDKVEHTFDKFFVRLSTVKIPAESLAEDWPQFKVALQQIFKEKESSQHHLRQALEPELFSLLISSDSPEASHVQTKSVGPGIRADHLLQFLVHLLRPPRWPPKMKSPKMKGGVFSDLVNYLELHDRILPYVKSLVTDAIYLSFQRPDGEADWIVCDNEIRRVGHFFSHYRSAFPTTTKRLVLNSGIFRMREILELILIKDPQRRAQQDGIESSPTEWLAMLDLKTRKPLIEVFRRAFSLVLLHAEGNRDPSVRYQIQSNLLFRCSYDWLEAMFGQQASRLRDWCRPGLFKDLDAVEAKARWKTMTSVMDAESAKESEMAILIRRVEKLELQLKANTPGANTSDSYGKTQWDLRSVTQERLLDRFLDELSELPRRGPIAFGDGRRLVDDYCELLWEKSLDLFLDEQEGYSDFLWLERMKRWTRFKLSLVE
jgi:hypothetical protein